MSVLLPRFSPSRRALLGGGAAALCAAGLRAGRARAATGGERLFLFVFAQGGWDPTRTLQAEFDNPAVSMEPDAEPATAGGIRYVDHPDRPSVRAFMEAWHSRTLVLNGVLVRSIAHDICLRLMMTGTTSESNPDWAAAIAAAGEGHPLPELVLSGPSFPGELGVAVARAGDSGQLSALLDGSAVRWGNTNAPGLPLGQQERVEALLGARLAARSGRSARESELLAATRQSLAQAQELRRQADLVAVEDTGDTLSAMLAGVDVLAAGISRCVMVGTTGGFAWDTHANNDAGQSPLWEELFASLGGLLDRLSTTPGRAAPTLLDETVVVVLSELGRTPALNGGDGKDHWPYTSSLVIGPGLAGDRVVGGFDSQYYGRNVDPATGDLDDDGQILSAEAVGATLLALADVDPADYVMGVEPITGVLA